uniref:Uncharacterized protein n=1 Tax=Glossina austeni TaxID=7395 RepID=A0A1A9VX02_GLOAU
MDAETGTVIMFPTETGEASSVHGSIRRSADNLNHSDENDDDDDDDDDDDNDNVDDDNNNDDDNNEKKNATEIDASKEQLPIASIKSRAIAMDRDLCRILSRYHPHYPRCYNYCEKLGHWMGIMNFHFRAFNAEADNSINSFHGKINTCDR